MRPVSLLIALALIQVSGAAIAQTDPSGRKLQYIKPPPPDTGSTGIIQVGRVAKPPAPAAPPPQAAAGCSVSAAPATTATGCSTTAQAAAPESAASTSAPAATYQRLRMGKIDFETEPDRRPTNQAIKAAIVGAARNGNRQPGQTAPPQATQRPGSGYPPPSTSR